MRYRAVFLETIPKEGRETPLKRTLLALPLFLHIHAVPNDRLRFLKKFLYHRLDVLLPRFEVHDKTVLLQPFRCRLLKVDDAPRRIEHEIPIGIDEIHFGVLRLRVEVYALAFLIGSGARKPEPLRYLLHACKAEGFYYF